MKLPHNKDDQAHRENSRLAEACDQPGICEEAGHGCGEKGAGQELRFVEADAEGAHDVRDRHVDHGAGEDHDEERHQRDGDDDAAVNRVSETLRNGLTVDHSLLVFLVPEARKRRSFVGWYLRRAVAQKTNFILQSTSWRQKERPYPRVTVAHLELDLRHEMPVR